MKLYLANTVLWPQLYSRVSEAASTVSEWFHDPGCIIILQDFFNYYLLHFQRPVFTRFSIDYKEEQLLSRNSFHIDFTQFAPFHIQAYLLYRYVSTSYTNMTVRKLML